MKNISEKITKTKEMKQYEEETGKKAIWRDMITEGFKKWKKGEKIYDKDKERITFYLSPEIKEKWQIFAKKNKYSTISKLIREGVSNYIDNYHALLRKNNKILDIDLISKLSHNFKEPLTAIKGYLQLINEEYKDVLDEQIHILIQKVLDQTKILENKIIEELETVKTFDKKFDILLIEDNTETVELLKSFFESKGITCKYVLTGLKAIEILKSTRPKLILLDILLPDLNGFEICKSIKKNEELKDIPVFYLTAVPGSKVKEKMEETKADGMILKPFDLTDLKVLFEYL